MTHQTADDVDTSEFAINVPGAGKLGPVASAALVSLAQAFAEEVFEEASRYEALQRANPSGPPEFTSRHVRDADDAVRRRSAPSVTKSPSSRRVAGSVGLYAFAAGVGVGGNQLDEKWGLAVFVACLVAGLFTVALLEIDRGGQS